MEQKNVQPFLAPATRPFLLLLPGSGGGLVFPLQSLEKQRLCTHLDDRPQPGIHCGQEVLVGKEVPSWWVCRVKYRSRESYMSKELRWRSLHW